MNIPWTVESPSLGRWFVGGVGLGAIVLSAYLFFAWAHLSFETIERFGGYIPVTLAMLSFVIPGLAGGASAILVSSRTSLTPRFVVLTLLAGMMVLVVAYAYEVKMEDYLAWAEQQHSQAQTAVQSIH